MCFGDYQKNLEVMKIELVIWSTYIFSIEKRDEWFVGDASDFIMDNDDRAPNTLRVVY